MIIIAPKWGTKYIKPAKGRGSLLLNLPAINIDNMHTM
jgi:hypothetical protein